MERTLTPWGEADYSRTVAEGITWYSTSDHGGLHVSPECLAKMPEPFRLPGGWYEEDIDWSLVVICFPLGFDGDTITRAHRVAKDWRPDEYREAFGEDSVREDESRTLRRRQLGS